MDWRTPVGALIPGLEGPVLEALWRSNHALTGGDVWRMARAGSYPGVRLALGRLAAQGVVSARRSGAAILYELNREHLAYPALAAAFGAYDPVGELARRLHDLAVAHDPATTIGFRLAIFGSVARREAGVDSDLDLLLVHPDEHAGSAEILADALRAQAALWTGNEVQVVCLSMSAMRMAVDGRDPVVESWDRDAVTVLGDDVRGLWAGRT
jgi:predicted nucleotidyltransferase